MKKMILSVVGLLLMGAASAMASNELVIHLTSGIAQRFVLISEQPTITFEGDNIVVKTTTAEVSYAMEDVNYFNYEDQTMTPIDEVTTADGMKITGDHISLSGLPAGSKVTVYGAAGQLYITETVDEDGHANVSLARLARGVYIINAANLSTKITKK
jgi:hypothetical protein